MSILRIKEIRSMSDEERKKKLMELKTELTRLRTLIRAGGSIDNPARIKEIKRAIARILTVEREAKR